MEIFPTAKRNWIPWRNFWKVETFFLAPHSNLCIFLSFFFAWKLCNCFSRRVWEWTMADGYCGGSIRSSWRRVIHSVEQQQQQQSTVFIFGGAGGARLCCQTAFNCLLRTALGTAILQTMRSFLNPKHIILNPCLFHYPLHMILLSVVLVGFGIVVSASNVVYWCTTSEHCVRTSASFINSNKSFFILYPWRAECIDILRCVA